MMQNNRAKRIAVTGGIGSGKSTVTELIRKAGYPVFSCDEIYKELQQNKEYLREISSRFRGVVVNEKLDREKLAVIVFSDKEKLRELNAIAHPLIMKKLFDEMNKYPLSFAEVPLLFENGFEKDFDGVIIVYRNTEARVAAVCARDGTTKEKTLARIKNQVDYEKIIKEGHTVIYNDGDLSSLQKKVTAVLEKISL